MCGLKAAVRSGVTPIEVATEEVGEEESAEVADVGVVVDGGAAGVHADGGAGEGVLGIGSGGEGGEGLEAVGEGVVEAGGHGDLVRMQVAGDCRARGGVGGNGPRRGFYRSRENGVAACGAR